MMRRTWTVVAFVCMGCPAEDDNDGNTTTPITSATNDSESSESDSTTDASTTSISASATMSTSEGSSEGSSGASMSSESTAVAESSSSGDPNACNPVIPGEWNNCHDDMGGVDTTLCNWMGNPDATGFIGCLVSADMEEYSTCFISGCEDACDCFAPPTTGTAVVECADILADGGTGCHLNCSDGATCPDGMECVGTSCFWPPA